MIKSIFKNVVTTILVITMIVSLNNSIQTSTNRYNFSIYYTYFQHNSSTYQIVVPIPNNGCMKSKQHAVISNRHAVLTKSVKCLR